MKSHCILDTQCNLKEMLNYRRLSDNKNMVSQHGSRLYKYYIYHIFRLGIQNPMKYSGTSE